MLSFVRLQTRYLRPLTRFAQTNIKPANTLLRSSSLSYNLSKMSGFASGEAPTYSMGPKTLTVPMELFAENRRRVVEEMKKQGQTGVILVKGGDEATRHSSDHEPIFRQESYFHWFFGVIEAGCAGAIDIESGKAHLFIPRLPEAYGVWMGDIKPVEHFPKSYAVEGASYVEDIPKFMSDNYASAPVHVLYGQNTDSKNFTEPASFDGMENFAVNRDALFPIACRLRTKKTAYELEVIKYVFAVSSAAHVEVLRNVRPGWMEYEIESLFRHFTYSKGGCRNLAYTAICAAGHNAATLHYGHAGAPNDFEVKDGQMVLTDMGVEYSLYCSDITVTFPSNGKYTEDQKVLYNSVLNAVKTVETQLKPGVKWLDMHEAALVEVAKGLLQLGILKNGTAKELVDKEIVAHFMPSGLGHFIGIDTHDVGGYLQGAPERSSRYGFRNCRTAAVLEEGHVITVEPGCYFITCEVDKMMTDPAFEPYVDRERLEQFRGFGGIRIEDTIHITKDGYENYTQTPHSIEEIESVMAGAAWPPAADSMPELKRQWTTWNY